MTDYLLFFIIIICFFRKFYYAHLIIRFGMNKSQYLEKSKFHAYRSKYEPRVPTILRAKELHSQTESATILP